MSAAVLTVSQVNFFLKSLIEGDGRLTDVLISGEISNFTDHYRSGHLYFSLKDEKSVLKAVMFAGSARRLRFRPEDGMKVIIRGRVSVYEPSGAYQLYAEEMQPDGIGALSLAFEQLKGRLAEEGLFAASRKRPIPVYPSRIGVITSPTGAAVQDILQITGRRWPLAEIIFCPVAVQGENAALQLTEAVKRMNRWGNCDVILLGRGGGSMEDLWAFNDENLARTVVSSHAPIISAVGHETDFTICDFAADLRAPTPSAAAELATPELDTELQRVTALREYFRVAPQKQVEQLRQWVDNLVDSSPLRNPDVFLSGHRQTLSELSKRLLHSLKTRIDTERSSLLVAGGKLDALSPLKVLGRGYSLLYDEKDVLLTKKEQLALGQQITIQFSDGTAQAAITCLEE